MSIFKKVAAFFTPVMTESKFLAKGVLTPAEFVVAGDELVAKCKSWEWAAGDPKLAVKYLPKNKQYLICRNVPCVQRVKEFYAIDDKVKQDGPEGWDIVGAAKVDNSDDSGLLEEKQPATTTTTTTTTSTTTTTTTTTTTVESEGDDDALLGDDDDDLLLEDEGDGSLLVEEEQPTESSSQGESKSSSIVKTRTYDMSIVYSNYYRTPRVYLFGYDENRKALSKDQILEDISEAHANKTATFENHPHISVAHVSIHPCRHAEVMKRMVAKLGRGKQESSKSEGKQQQEEELSVHIEQYLFIFLKFIQTVIPTMEYDFALTT